MYKEISLVSIKGTPFSIGLVFVEVLRSSVTGKSDLTGFRLIRKING